MTEVPSLHTNTSLGDIYGEEFYRAAIDASMASARRYAEVVSRVFTPSSVVDLGCGRGAWLKAFKEVGATTLVGYDGAWNAAEQMIDSHIEFHSADLDQPVREARRFDLALSLEVAEHLQPASGEHFIDSLARLSDVVLFSAAYIKQGGPGHINERAHSYWARLFHSHGYLPYDLFRPLMWGDETVPFWYQQNAFLYIKQNTHAASQFAQAGSEPMHNIRFVDCVHPLLYDDYWPKNVATVAARELVKELLRRVTRRARRFVGTWRVR